MLFRSALWLSNKPLETHQAVQLFDSAIRFMTRHEPNNQILTATKTLRDRALEALDKFESKDTIGLALLEASHGSLGR